MSHAEIAVLSYHGWEIDPERAADDVRSLRERGWRDVSLEEMELLLSEGSRRVGRFFHVTSDDGGKGDRELVAALGVLGCPVTLFVSLGAMSAVEKAVHRELLTLADVRIEDHSLRHDRVFHYRQVIGFHSDAQPLVTSPERLHLSLGSPVCVYGGELVRPRFRPDEGAIAVCQQAARSIAEQPGSRAWKAEIAQRLVKSGFGFRRLGKLCVRGDYESQVAYERRVSHYLAEGRRCLEEFIGRPPVAFAHPWWLPSPFAEGCLRDLGYRLTFSGKGVCRQSHLFQIPRLFVQNDTPRPINPDALGVTGAASPLLTRFRELGRRAVYG